MGNNAYQQLESILNTTAADIKQLLLKKSKQLRPFPTFYAGIGKGAWEVPQLGQAAAQLNTELVRNYVKMLVPGHVCQTPGIMIAGWPDDNPDYRIFTPQGLYRCPGRVFFGEWLPLEIDRMATRPAWDLREEDTGGYVTHGREILEIVQEHIHELPRTRALEAERLRRLKDQLDYESTLQD